MVDKLYKSEDPNSAKKPKVGAVEFSSPSRDISIKLGNLEPTDVTKPAEIKPNVAKEPKASGEAAE